MGTNSETILGFMNISALLDELGNFHIIPNFTSNNRHNISIEDIESPFSAKIITKNSIHIKRKLAASKINACGPEARVGLNYMVLWGSIPLPNNAEKFVVLEGEKILYEKRITAPKNVRANAEINNNKLKISWHRPQEENVFLFAKLETKDGNNLFFQLPQNSLEFEESLSGFVVEDEVNISIIGSDGLNHTTFYEKKHKLNPSPPMGLIITPGNGDEFEFSRPISLIGNCTNAFGESVPWQEHGIIWKIDGSKYAEAPSVLLSNLIAGEHIIELYSKKWKSLLHSIKINITPESIKLKTQKKILKKSSKYFRQTPKKS